MREIVCVVGDFSKQFIEEKYPHATYVPDKDLTVTFYMRDIMSYLPTRLPSDDEIDSWKRIKIKSKEEFISYSGSQEENEGIY